MSTFRKTVLVFVLVFLALSIGLPSCSTFVTLAFFFEDYGENYVLDFLEVLSCIGNWPSMLLKTLPHYVDENGNIIWSHFDYFHGPALLSNVIGWTLLGFIFGLIVGFVASKVRRK